VAGREACRLGKGLAAEMVDANGSVLVTTEAAEPGGPVSLEPGASFTVGITWSNWCGAAPAEPMLALKMSGWESFAPVAVRPPSGQTRFHPAWAAVSPPSSAGRVSSRSSSGERVGLVEVTHLVA